ncbi:hypothetical protein GCM10027174_38600 [Salinifilum aidingensis]
MNVGAACGGGARNERVRRGTTGVRAGAAVGAAARGNEGDVATDRDDRCGRRPRHRADHARHSARPRRGNQPSVRAPARGPRARGWAAERAAAGGGAHARIKVWSRARCGGSRVLLPGGRVYYVARYGG